MNKKLHIQQDEARVTDGWAPSSRYLHRTIAASNHRRRRHLPPLQIQLASASPLLLAVIGDLRIEMTAIPSPFRISLSSQPPPPSPS
ncbi:unnamed protein product [Cuscuta campestris]|uniref:Uncharacterized protein n=1 Tax=Cuscuta campestris TaxID=132261 RepID=A0A484LJH8_9ASTE|nr:unnamed protein product [Cuscuta campestris]